MKEMVERVYCDVCGNDKSNFGVRNWLTLERGFQRLDLCFRCVLRVHKMTVEQFSPLLAEDWERYCKD